MTAAQFESALHIEDVLAREGVFVGTTAGSSMWPLLRHRRDTVVIRPCAARLRAGDVPLYRRGDAYVLHRVVEVLPDSYVICGDNCAELERGVRDEQMVGVLESFYRGERPVSLDSRAYRAYVRAWRALCPLRRAWKRMRARAGRVARSLAKGRS